MNLNIKDSLYTINNDIILKTEILAPKIIWALIIILIWWVFSFFSYKILISLFKKFKLNEIIDKFKIELDVETIKENEEKVSKKKLKSQKFTNKIKVDSILSKSISYYIFIIFFRLSISYIWIKEVELFLKDLINYLPSLFVWVLIWFFGVRFANFVYDIVYHALNITREKTSKIIAYTWKIIILFFTLMLVLDYTKIVSEFIINVVLVWFIWMIALAWWLAFWLWWKDIANEILESFRK